MKEYIFKSKRLGFRVWDKEDFMPLANMNQDVEVMEYFPDTISYEDSMAFIKKMQQQYDEKGYCYFAVDELKSGDFIGFIGLSYQDYEGGFVDIGWRLARAYWRKGYASEGALECLKFAKDVCKLDELVAVAPVVNIPSVNVMAKIGMQFHKNFEHPALKDYPYLKECVMYRYDLKDTPNKGKQEQKSKLTMLFQHSMYAL